MLTPDLEVGHGMASGSGRIRAPLQSGPVVICAAGIVAGRPLLGLLGLGTQCGFAGRVVMRFSGGHDVAEARLHGVEFRGGHNVFLFGRQDARNFPLRIFDAFGRWRVRGEHPRNRARAALLVGLDALKESDVGIRVVPGLVHILQSQEISFALRVTTELQERQRKRDVQPLIEPVSGQSGGTQKNQGNRGELEYLSLGRVLRAMPRGQVGYFVRHDTRQFRLLLRAKNQSAIYIEESAWQSERIDHVGIDYLDREWHSRIRIAHEVLSDAAYILGYDWVVDELRRALNLLCQLLTERDFFFQRIEVGTLADFPIANRIDIVFGVFRVYDVLLFDGLPLLLMSLSRLGSRIRQVRRAILRQRCAHNQRSQK